MISTPAVRKSVSMFACGSGDVNQLLGPAIDFFHQHDIDHNRFNNFTIAHPLYVANYPERLNHMRRLLSGPDPLILWALRGGSGTTSLLPALQSIQPLTAHTVIGFSDVTALHLFCTKLWNWKTIHGPTLNYVQKPLHDNFWHPMIQFIKTGQLSTNVSNLVPLNSHATICDPATGILTGGNMSLIQASIGTFWQIEADRKIIFFEDIDEPPYRIAERLEHLNQTGVFHHAQAILFGDFHGTQLMTPTDQELLSFVLNDFAQRQSCSVFANLPVGHADRNAPMVINHTATVWGGRRGRFEQSFNSLID